MELSLSVVEYSPLKLYSQPVMVVLLLIKPVVLSLRELRLKTYSLGVLLPPQPSSPSSMLLVVLQLLPSLVLETTPSLSLVMEPLVLLTLKLLPLVVQVLVTLSLHKTVIKPLLSQLLVVLSVSKTLPLVDSLLVLITGNLLI